MTFLLSGRKLFLPSQHIWVRAIKVPKALTTPSLYLPDFSWSVDVGITNRGLEDIGDVHNYEFREGNIVGLNKNDGYKILESNRRRLLKSGRDIVLDIYWDAHLITAADELYHTIWETVSEITHITSPVDGFIEKYNTALLPKRKSGSMQILPILDEGMTLFTLRTKYECIESQMKNMCCEDQYREIIKRSKRGKFYEKEMPI
mmetsp:Transcript_15931/g.24130  ORF Transcript_15931/g.24130 Transcript_15931/m.24130 type:complete len:203 (+) Transcript_15931:107-715(+)